MGPETERYSEKRNKSPGYRPVAMLCAASLLLQACVAAPHIDVELLGQALRPSLAAPNIEEKTKAGFGTIGLVSASFTPEIDIPEPAASTEGGALVGDTLGALGGLAVGLSVFVAALSSCLFAPPACPAVAPYILGGAVAGGAVGASIGSSDEAKASAARESLDPVIEKQLIQDALRARVMAYAKQHGVGPLTVIDDPRPSTPEGLPDYRHLSGKGIDTVLEVRLLELKLEKVSIFSDKYQPRTVAQARVIRVRDHAILSDQAYGVWGRQAVIDSWVGDNGRRFQTWVKYAYATLAEYILDEMILVYRPVSVKKFVATGADRTSTDVVRLGGLTGFGLHPEHPELRRADVCFFCEESAKTASFHLFTEVDTLRPEFRWQPLVGPGQSADHKAPKAGQSTDVVRLGGLTGFGLHPEHPELRRADVCFFCEESAKTASFHLFTEVDTLRPEFRWQPLVGPGQSADHKAPEKIQDVKYEIRLFTVQHLNFYENLTPDNVRIGPERLGGPIYSRSGLVEPGHRIEQSLAPCTKYFWTVRARFRVDGQPRVTRKRGRADLQP